MNDIEAEPLFAGLACGRKKVSMNAIIKLKQFVNPGLNAHLRFMRFPSNEVQQLKCCWYHLVPAATSSLRLHPLLHPIHLMVDGSCSIHHRAFQQEWACPCTVCLTHPSEVMKEFKHRWILNNYLINILRERERELCVCVYSTQTAIILKL